MNVARFSSLIACLVFTSCKTNFQTQFLTPPKADLALSSKKVVLVNQTGKLAATKAIDWFHETANKVPAYEFLLSDDIISVEGDSAFFYSAEKICQQNNAEALLVLEDFKTGVTISKLNLGLSNYSMMNEWQATLKLDYELNWKWYNSQTNSIVDEYGVSSSNIYSGKGADEIEAEAALPYYKDVIDNIVFEQVQQYAHRTLPIWENVNRYYYSNVSNKNMRKAAKYAKKKDWKMAADYWRKTIDNSDSNNKNLCVYNMAVACEMEGNIDEAIRWAQIAYFEYGFVDAGDYILVLRKRALNNYNVVEHYSQVHNSH